MTTPAAATTGSPKELRVNTPTPFEGDRSKLRTFLLDCELYLLINREIYDHDDKKIAFVLSYLTGGDASMWKNQWLQSKRAGAAITLGTYVAFFDDLTNAFKEEEQVQNALHKIHNLRQTKNMLVEELNTEFRLLVGRAGLTWPTTAVVPAANVAIGSNETLLIDAYRRALNPKTCTRILMGETTPRSLAGWMAKAVTLDNNWRQTQMMRGDYNSGPSKNSKNGRSYRYKSQNDRDPMAMDIDAVINALSPEECQDLMKKGLCFYCKKNGHRVEDCDKKPPSNRSGNGGNQGKNRRDYRGKNNENKTKKFESNKGKEIAKHIRALVDKLEDEEYTVFNQSMVEEGLFEHKEGSDDEDNKDF